MVGDRKFDISAGKSAGFRTIGVTWGFGDRQELETSGADLPWLRFRPLLKI